MRNSLEVNFTVYESHDEGASCPGDPANERFFEPQDKLTLCFETVNTGDQALTNVALAETVLGIESADDLITVFGDADSLLPGQSLIQAYEITAERDQALRLSVTATPTDGTSSAAVGPTVRTNSTPVVRIDEDAVDPGFGDGFGAAVSLLAGLWQLVRVVAGFIVPMLIFVPFIWAAVVLLKRLRRRRAEANAQARVKAQPPAPVPPTSTPGHKPAADSTDD